MKFSLVSLRALLLWALLPGVFASPLFVLDRAQADPMASAAYTAAVLDLNRVKPAQNPAFKLGKTVLARRILDKNQRTIGRVEDIVLTSEGRFQTVLARLDVSGFRETVSLGMTSYIVDPTPDTLTVAMDKEQIKQNMPVFLAGVETAAGSESLPLTLSAFKGAPVRRSDGMVIARVQDTLIDSDAHQVVALLVTVLNGRNRGATMAIPYEATAARRLGDIADLAVTDDQAQSIASLSAAR